MHYDIGLNEAEAGVYGVHERDHRLEAGQPGGPLHPRPLYQVPSSGQESVFFR